MLLAPGELAGDVKNLLLVMTTAIAHLVEQFTHDPKLESMNPVAASTRRSIAKRH